MHDIDLFGYFSLLYSYKQIYEVFKEYIKSADNDFVYFEEKIDRAIIATFMGGHTVLCAYHLPSTIIFNIVELLVFLLLYSILRYFKKGKNKLSLAILMFVIIVFLFVIFVTLKVSYS